MLEQNVAKTTLPAWSPGRPTDAAADEEPLVDRLRAGDEAAFEWLVSRYAAGMKRLARSAVRDPDVADEVVQETWLAVLKGLDRFEGRSSRRTWIFRILLNRASSRAKRETKMTASYRLHDGSPEQFRSGGTIAWIGNALNAPRLTPASAVGNQRSPCEISNWSRKSPGW